MKISKFFFNNIKTLILISLFFVFFITFVFFLPVQPYDELWNFQNVYKIFNNFILYTDANVIITPLFFYISQLMFKIFGATFFTFRILNIFLFTAFFILIYLIFKTLKVSKHINLLFISIIFTQIHEVINGGSNYNTLAIIFMLLGLLFYLNLEKKKYFHYLQGVVVFLVFFSKQNLGIYYACSIMIFEFIYKEKISIWIKEQLKKFFSFITLLLISLLTFFENGNLFDFLNYAFGGLLNFGKSNLGWNAELYIISICIFTLISYFYIILNKNIKISLKRRKTLCLFACIAIGSTFSVFPIINDAHFLYIIVFYFLILFYFLDFAILEDCFTSKKIISLSYTISIIIVSLTIIRSIYIYTAELKNFVKINNTINPLHNFYISQENYEKMNTMTNYVIEKNQIGKEVIIIASDACLTTIPTQKNNGAFDLPFKGNLGYDGENKMIEQIKKSKDTEFLIFTSEEDCFWQESEIIREYIIKNLTKTGEILNYSIYENK